MAYMPEIYIDTIRAKTGKLRPLPASVVCGSGSGSRCRFHVPGIAEKTDFEVGGPCASIPFSAYGDIRISAVFAAFTALLRVKVPVPFSTSPG